MILACVAVIPVLTGKNLPDLFKPAEPTAKSQTINTAPTLTNTPVVTATSKSMETSSSELPWQGKYYDNNAFQAPAAYEREDDEININWGDSNPAPNIPTDRFSVRWTKCTEFEERYYTFTISAKTYAKIYVNDVEVMDSHILEKLDYFMPSGMQCITVAYVHTINNAFIFFDIK